MIHATVKMDIAPENIKAALQILLPIVERTRANKACLDCSVYQDTSNENLIVFEEKWRSEEDMTRHLKSDEYQRVLLVMEMAVRAPEIRFDTISSTGGVEVIEKARAKQGE